MHWKMSSAKFHFVHKPISELIILQYMSKKRHSKLIIHRFWIPNSGNHRWNGPPGPLLLNQFYFNPTWISNYIQCYVWDEINNPFSLIDNFIPHFTGHVFTYPCGDNLLTEVNPCSRSVYLPWDYDIVMFYPIGNLRQPVQKEIR